MKFKTLEIRDRGTSIPALAFNMEAENQVVGQFDSLLNRFGI